MSTQAYAKTGTQSAAKINSWRVLGRAIALYARHFVSFTLSAAVVFSPILLGIAVLIALVLSGEAGPATSAAIHFFDYGFFGLLGLLLPALSGVVAFGALQFLRGATPMTPGRFLTDGLARVRPALSTVVVVGLLSLLGLAMAVLPGLIVLSMLAVAVPAAVIQAGRGPAALGDSQRLTKGQLTEVFSVLVGGAILQNLIPLVYRYGLFDISSAGAVESSVVTYLALRAIFLVLGGALTAVAATVLFVEVKELRDGVEIDDLG